MAAEKGNQYALGNNGGRPPVYETPEELAEAVEDYLANNEVKTVTGLALALGFSSRQSLYDYGKKEEFSYIIARAKLWIENYYELQLLTSNSATGPKFALQQMGWRDSQQIDHTSKGDKIQGSPIIVQSQGEEPQVE